MTARYQVSPKAMQCTYLDRDTGRCLVHFHVTILC